MNHTQKTLKLLKCGILKLKNVKECFKIASKF